MISFMKNLKVQVIWSFIWTANLRNGVFFQHSISVVQVLVEKSCFLRKEELDKLWVIRKNMNDTPEFIDGFLKKLGQTKTNEEFLATLESKNGSAPLSGNSPERTSSTGRPAYQSGGSSTGVPNRSAGSSSSGSYSRPAGSSPTGASRPSTGYSRPNTQQSSMGRTTSSSAPLRKPPFTSEGAAQRPQPPVSSEPLTRPVVAPPIPSSSLPVAEKAAELTPSSEAEVRVVGNVSQEVPSQGEVVVTASESAAADIAVSVETAVVKNKNKNCKDGNSANS